MRFIDPDGMWIDDFFNRQGQYTHSTSEGNNIVIQDNGVNSKLTDYNYSSNNTENREMLANVATHYAQEAGLEKSASVITNKVSDPIASVDTKTGKPNIIVSKSGELNKEANFTGNLISSFVHEKGHVAMIRRQLLWERLELLQNK